MGRSRRSAVCMVLGGLLMSVLYVPFTVAHGPTWSGMRRASTRLQSQIAARRLRSAVSTASNGSTIRVCQPSPTCDVCPPARNNPGRESTLMPRSAHGGTGHVGTAIAHPS